jgi:hypothetical protein
MLVLASRAKNGRPSWHETVGEKMMGKPGVKLQNLPGICAGYAKLKKHAFFRDLCFCLNLSGCFGALGCLMWMFGFTAISLS